MLDRAGSIYSVIGIPPPPGNVIAFKKYHLCNDLESIWKRGNRRYCRLVQDYTQYSILTHTLTVMDPRFNTEVPVISTMNIERTLDPFNGLHRILTHPEDTLQYTLIDFLSEINRETGIRLDSWGVTGSILAGIHNPDKSDIDLILIGEEPSKAVFEYMKKRQFPRIVNWASIQSRYEMDPRILKLISKGRSRFMWKNHKISIIFIEGDIYHPKYCETFHGFLTWNAIVLKEAKRFKGIVKIDSNKGALTYPPCVDTGNYLLMSFDHALAPILEESRCLSIDTLSGRTVDGIDIVFLGVKERRLTKIKSC